jgi:preprotein translocase subunit SecA
MRVFASDMLKSMMGKLGMPEDEPIEHKLISRALESAQEKIEGFNFDARKNVLEFDDVINHQRSTIYARRRKLLLGSAADVEQELFAMIEEGNAAVGAAAKSARNSLGLKGGGVGAAGGVGAPAIAAEDAKKVIEEARKMVEKKVAEFGREPFLQAVRVILLQTTDMFWVEHLEVMDYTRSSVNLRAYGQRDPLVEYKREGLRLYKEMQAAARDQFLRILPNIVPVQNGQPVKQGGGNPSGEGSDVQKAAEEITAGDGSGKALSTASDKKEPGRNDQCPCGSGKKYKKCHGAGK